MQTVLITGVSRGIGNALAHTFLSEGYFVLGTSTSGEALIQNENFKVFEMDLSRPETIQKCVTEIKMIDRKIDILINNAGMSVLAEESESTIIIDYLRQTLEVNLIGTIDFTERIIPSIQSNGHIVNVSSRAGSLQYEGYNVHAPAYRISKAGLNMFTKILSKRFGDTIKVSSVHPGWTQTDMGGEDAEQTPEETATEIFKLAVSDVETGQFWFKQNKFPW